MLEITITGDRAVVERLNTLDRAFDTTPPVADVAAVALPPLRVYPPERPGQKYIRTGRLGEGWGAVPGGQVISFENRVPYAGDVYGPNQGAAFAGRWPTREALVERIRPAVIDAYRAWAAKVVQGAK